MTDHRYINIVTNLIQLKEKVKIEELFHTFLTDYKICYDNQEIVHKQFTILNEYNNIDAQKVIK